MKHPTHDYELDEPAAIAKRLRDMQELGAFNKGEDLRTNLLMVKHALQETCDWLAARELRDQGMRCRCKTGADVAKRLEVTGKEGSGYLGMPDLQE